MLKAIPQRHSGTPVGPLVRQSASGEPACRRWRASLLYDPEVQNASVVLVGNFNPAIFSPAWLAKNGVITDGELEAVEMGIVHAECTQFNIDTLKIDIVPNRLAAISFEEPYASLLDFLLIIFNKLCLTHRLTRLE